MKMGWAPSCVVVQSSPQYNLEAMDIGHMFPLDFTADQVVERMKRRAETEDFQTLIARAINLIRWVIEGGGESGQEAIYGDVTDSKRMEQLEVRADIVVEELVRRGFKASIRRDCSNTYVGSNGCHRSTHHFVVENPSLPLSKNV